MKRRAYGAPGGAAGATGAGLATLVGGLASHRPALVPGVGLIVAIDRFISEAKALKNFSDNAVANLVIGSWVKAIDQTEANHVLDRQDPFNDAEILDEQKDSVH